MTKEHVIPRWVIRLFGGDKEELRIWMPLRETGTSVTEFSQSSLQFPACDPCNQAFASLETEAKSVIERVVAWAPLSSADFCVLLDWLDKVRIGVWLGMRILERNPFAMPVRFHVSQRIARKDRAVLIYRVDEAQVGWACLGTSTPSFHKHPSCFTLVLGSIYFFNVSTDYLLARSMGVPYPTHATIRAGGDVEFAFVPGTHRIGAPFLPFSVAPHCGMVVQPIFGDLLTLPLRAADHAYLRSFGILGHHSAGPIFTISADDVAAGADEPTRAWQPERTYSKTDHLSIFLRQTLTAQNALGAFFITDNPAAMDDIVSSRKFNDACLREIDARN